MIEMRWRVATTEEYKKLPGGEMMSCDSRGRLLEYRHRPSDISLPVDAEHAWSEWTVVPVVTE